MKKRTPRRFDRHEHWGGPITETDEFRLETCGVRLINHAGQTVDRCSWFRWTPRDQLLDLVGPYRGPCGICGGPDARHRFADAIAGQVRAGDSAESVAEDYGISIEAAERLAKEYFE